LPVVAGAGIPGLQRTGHQPVARHHPAPHLHLGGFRAAAKPGLRTGGRAAHHPDHPDVHGLVVLRVPRQGACRRGVPLMRAPATSRSRWVRRMLWLLAIWAASVAVLGLAAWVLRLVMGLAGMTR